MTELSVVEKDLTQEEAQDMGGDLNHVFRVVVRMKTECRGREESVCELGGHGELRDRGGGTSHQRELKGNAVGNNENDKLVCFIVKTAPMQVLVRRAAHHSLLVPEVYCCVRQQYYNLNKGGHICSLSLQSGSGGKRFLWSRGRLSRSMLSCATFMKHFLAASHGHTSWTVITEVVSLTSYMYVPLPSLLLSPFLS